MASGSLTLTIGTLTSDDVDKLTSSVLTLIQSSQKDPSEFEQVTALTGVSSIPVLYNYGTAYKLVRVALSLLKGTDASEIDVAVNNGVLQWRRGTSGTWTDLLTIASITGQTPVFATDSSGIKWKYTNEDDTAYRSLVSYDNLKLTFDNLTDAQKETLKMHLSDLTAEDIAELQQPAKDATEAANTAASAANSAASLATQHDNAYTTAEQARDASEKQRDANETVRKDNENTRSNQEAARQSQEDARISGENERKAQETTRNDQETARQTQESTRQSQETARKDAESARVTAETNREAQFQTSKTAVDDATANAEAVVNHPSYVGSDYYLYVWDVKTNAYIKTSSQFTPSIFTIYNTYSSVDAMTADAVNVSVGKLVIINTGNTEDEDTGKLYVRTTDSFQYLVDLSGFRGFVGKTPQLSVGTVNGASTAPSVTISPDGTDADGNPKYKFNFVLQKGDTGNSSYQDWLANGHTGEYSDYLAYLRQPATDEASAVASAESLRVKAEGDRVTAENTRATNENARKANESARISNETARQDAETARNNAEGLRASAETSRENAEKARETAKSAMETATSDANTAAANAQDAINNLNKHTAELVDLESNRYGYAYVENGVMYFFASQSDYDTNGIDGALNSQPVGSGGGSGSGTGNVTTKLKALSALSSKVVLGNASVIRYNFTSVYADDSSSTGNGTAQYYVGGTLVKTLNIEQGDNSFDCTSYLTTGSNSVKIKITDSTGAVRQVTFVVEVIALSITSTFDATQPFTGAVTFKYIPFGDIEKTVHFVLDNTELGTAVTTVSNRQLTYSIPAQAHGRHLLQVYITAVVDEVTITSNYLYYDLICITEGNTTPIVASSFVQSTAKQYDRLSIPFVVYDPSNITASITMMSGSTVVSTGTVDRTQQTWNYRIPTTGALSLSIKCGSATKTFSLTVTEADVVVNAVSSDLQLYLSSVNRSNNDTNKSVWSYGNYTAVMSGFNYSTNGWIANSDGSVSLRISGDARVTIPFNIFSEDFRTKGKTIEIEFETRDVSDYEAIVMSCFSGNIGFKVSAQQALLWSEQTKVSTRFKEEERVRVSFVIEKDALNRLVYIYINGIMSGVAQYPSNDNFQQTTPVGITIGNSDCTVDIYNIRVYDSDLTQYDLLQNYMADMDDYDRKVGIYRKNQIYNAYGNVSFDLMSGFLPCLIIEGDLPTYKGDKKTCAMYYTDKQNPANSWSCASVQNDVQGTSSQYYPRKNYKFKFKTSITMSESGESASTFALSPDQIAVNCFCIKADFAESSGTHNTGLAYIIGNLLSDLEIQTPPQKTNPQVRTTVYGFPICVFHRASSTGDLEFFGKYNFNNDKSTVNTFGFATGDECWEFLNNTSDRTLFKKSDYAAISGGAYEWLSDFEARYPDDDAINTTYANGIVPPNLKEVTDWIASTMGDTAKFKSELAKHFVLDNLLAYYVITELFGMVDQRAKNMFLTHFASDVDADGNKLWRFIFYDNDTCLGINNEGQISFDYSIEYHDTIGNLNVWNGEQSVLWNNLETCFAEEIEALYKEIRTNSYLTYEKIMSVLNTRQSDKWCESVYNEDGRFKYVLPLVNDGNSSYLYAAQGSRKEHRKWWMYNRLNYMDSKYTAGNFLTDFATLRLYTPSSYAGVTPSANITVTPYSNGYVRVKYGSYMVGSRCTKGVASLITAPAITFNDTETIIYGASKIASLGDLSPLYAGTVDVSNCSRLTELNIGSAVAGYSNANLTTLSVGTNTLLRKLDIRNCPNLTQAVDISGCTSIEEFYAEGTKITGVTLPVAGVLSVLHLPSTLSNLTIKNHPNLTDSGMSLAGIDNITSLVLENVSFDVFALVERCLALSTVNLSRLRLVGVSGTGTVSTLYALAQLGGIDEFGHNTAVAVVTGTYTIDTLTKADYDNLRTIFPNLTINYTHLTASTTVNVVSAKSKELSNVVFSSNITATKITSTSYLITGDVGTVITYSFSADNHVTQSGTATIGTDSSVTAAMTYIPLRWISVKEMNKTSQAVAASFTMDGATYTADASGNIYIRKLGAFTATLSAAHYNDTQFTLASASDDDTSSFQVLMKYIERTIKVVDYADNSIVLVGAVVTIGENTYTTDSSGLIVYYGDGSVSGTVKADNYNQGEFSFTDTLTSDNNASNPSIATERKIVRTIKVMETGTTTLLSGAVITIGGVVHTLTDGTYAIEGNDDAVTVTAASADNYNALASSVTFDAVMADVVNTIYLKRIVRTISVVDSSDGTTSILGATLTLSDSTVYSDTDNDGIILISIGSSISGTISVNDNYVSEQFSLPSIVSDCTSIVEIGKKDGKYQTAVSNGFIYRSVNFGRTWTQVGTSATWNSVAMSSDGKYQTAVASPGYIYRSTDYGQTWTQVGTSARWNSVAMSSDGKYQAASIYDGYIYRSTDYGQTWTQVGISGKWNSVAMSSDGKYQTAMNNKTHIYRSVDYGQNWAQAGPDGWIYWNSVAMSSDGKYQTAVASPGYIYRSTDYGQTWTQVGTSATWNSVAMSSDGKYQTASIYDGYIYRSTDYGQTWTQVGISATWNRIAVNKFIQS